MFAPSDAAASPVATGNALGKPRLTAGVFLLGDPTTTCCGFVNQVSVADPNILGQAKNHRVWNFSQIRAKKTRRKAPRIAFLDARRPVAPASPMSAPLKFRVTETRLPSGHFETTSEK